jgi:hypothetical protein
MKDEKRGSSGGFLAARSLLVVSIESDKAGLSVFSIYIYLMLLAVIQLFVCLFASSMNRMNESNRHRCHRKSESISVHFKSIWKRGTDEED